MCGPMGGFSGIKSESYLGTERLGREGVIRAETRFNS